MWGDPRDDRDVWRRHDPTALLPALAGIELFVAGAMGCPGLFEHGQSEGDPTEAEVGAETRAFVRRAKALGVPVQADLYGRRHPRLAVLAARELHRALPLLLGAMRQTAANA